MTVLLTGSVLHHLYSEQLSHSHEIQLHEIIIPPTCIVLFSVSLKVSLIIAVFTLGSLSGYFNEITDLFHYVGHVFLKLI